MGDRQTSVVRGLDDRASVEVDLPAADALGVPVEGLHWEFSAAESRGFGNAILSAIAEDEREEIAVSAPA